MTTVEFENGSKLKEIWDRAFLSCEMLQSITIPSGVKTLEYHAFENCYSLSEVVLQEGLKEVEQGAFLNCYSLPQINVPETVETIGGVAFGCIYEDGDYYSFSDFTVIGTLNSLAPLYADAYGMKYALPAPTLSSVKNTADGVKISFKKLSGVSGGKYRVYRKTSGKSWTKLADVTGTSYTDKTAKSGTSYTYTVRCVSSTGKSYVSGYDTTGTKNTFLAMPKVSKITNTVDGAKITWGKVTGAAKYNIYVKSGSSWKKLGESTTTSFTHTEAKSGTTYYYRVRAYDSTTNFVSAYKTAGDSNKFIAPPSITKLSNTSKGVKITWGKVSGATNYRVFVKSGSSWKKLGDTTSTSFTHTGAKKGTTYTYTIRCISSTGKSYVSGYDTVGKSILFKK